MIKFIKNKIVDRKIVIISDHKVKSVKISARLQYAAIAVLLAAAIWLPFSLGRVAAYNVVSSESAVILDNSKDVRDRLEQMDTDIQVLEEYMSRLYKDGKFFVNEKSGKQAEKKTNSEKFAELEQRKNKLISYLYSYTQSKSEQVEGILKNVGVNYSKLEAREEAAQNQGGPYFPLSFGDADEEGDKYAKNYHFSEGLVKDMDHLMRLQDIVAEMPFSSPIQTPRITSRFGVRSDPYNKRLAMHSGVDLAGRGNAAVYATAPGVVKKAGREAAYGNTVIIQHANGMTTRYAHLKRMYVKAGQYVERGNVIAMQGSTGRSTGDHLHYEVRFNGKAINPMRFLQFADRLSFYEVKY